MAASQQPCYFFVLFCFLFFLSWYMQRAACQQRSRDQLIEKPAKCVHYY